MKHAYIQPRVKKVSVVPFRFFAVSGTPEPSNKREHNLSTWVGSREGSIFDEEDEEEENGFGW